MHLNTLKPAPGSKIVRKRVGRGIGSGLGKTCGRGHKGQHARAGGFRKVGFEGGQMPLQRRLPKFGFTSHKALKAAELRLHELNQLTVERVDIEALKAANLITKDIKHVKIVATGSLNKALTICGIALTAGAKAAVEAAGGKVEA